MGQWLYDIGRAFQRISAWLFLSALIGLPFAVLLPRHPGQVLVIALVLGGLVRISLRRA